MKRFSLAFWLFALLLVRHAAGVTKADEPRLLLDDSFHLPDLAHLPRSPSQYLSVERIDYASHNAVEWQIRLRADVRGDQVQVVDAKSADFTVRFPHAGPIELRWSRGSHAEARDFEPRVERLNGDRPIVLKSFGGRSSDGVMPYFDLSSDGGGVILAVGWPGNWRVMFERTAADEVRFTAGLQHERLLNNATEPLPLPSILVMPYQGDWIDGRNRFRRLMLDHFTPQSHPPMELMPVAASVHGMIGFNDTNESNLVDLASDIEATSLPVNTFWLDAGWNEGGFPAAQGNPGPDPQRFPRGLAPIGRAVADAGYRFLVWFEPERVMRGTWIERAHPSWLAKPSGTPETLRYMENDGFRLLDLGNAEARSWVLDQISSQIDEAGVTIYRQDFNAYPEYFWREGSSDDAAAMRELRYVHGLYAFLDELAARHPGLILDNCASGGRRLDFEMMRRCVVLWRSDSCWDDPSYPRNVQAMTYGLSLWLPLHGLGAASSDTSALRSGMGACASFAIDFRSPSAVAALRDHLERYLPIRKLYGKEFHPLTPWSLDPDDWLAFQFGDAETGEGIVQAFRNPGAESRATNLKLRGLDPDARYVVGDWDDPASVVELSGAELMSDGISLQNAHASGCVVRTYSKRIP